MLADAIDAWWESQSNLMVSKSLSYSLGVLGISCVYFLQCIFSRAILFDKTLRSWPEKKHVRSLHGSPGLGKQFRWINRFLRRYFLRSNRRVVSCFAFFPPRKKFFRGLATVHIRFVLFLKKWLRSVCGRLLFFLDRKIATLAYITLGVSVGQSCKPPLFIYKMRNDRG